VLKNFEVATERCDSLAASEPIATNAGETPMKPFKKILVPVDFSPHALEAIHAAADLSSRYDASVTIVHVYEPVAYTLPEGYVLYTPKQLEELLREFDKLLASAKRDAEAAGARRVESKQLQGVAAFEIVEFAKANDFDLIVMGTHGRTGVRHVLLGSVAERVLRKAPCPVLTVKASESTAGAR
jgi:nucleotide-binding universal stress UspA family protein